MLAHTETHISLYICQLFYYVSDCYMYFRWASKNCSLAYFSLKYPGEVVAVVRFTLTGILYLMDDFLS